MSLVADLAEQCSLLEDQLVASQAREAKLREALAKISYAAETACGTAGRDEYLCDGIRRAANALALPADNSALQARLAEERERCAKACENHPDNLGAGSNFAAAIRNLEP